MSITGNRKAAFAKKILGADGASVGFVDIGSGGPLKAPWSYLPAEHLHTFDFEPTSETKSGLPLCVSGRSGIADFHVARDERASSLQEPDMQFVERFGFQSMLPKKTIQVECVTLDEYFSERFGDIDALDINVEGHDYQVLQGAERLLAEGFVKLIKIEFELAAAWQGQGYFSDIDAFMRNHAFELADLELEFGRPANVQHIYSKGEPLWGKAYYVPSRERWRVAIESGLGREHAIRACSVFVAAGLPGRACDVLDMYGLGDMKNEVFRVFGWARIEHGIGVLRNLAAATFRIASLRGGQ